MKAAGGRVELPAAWTAVHPLTDAGLRREAAEWSKAGPWPLDYRTT